MLSNYHDSHKSAPLHASQSSSNPSNTRLRVPILLKSLHAETEPSRKLRTPVQLPVEILDKIILIVLYTSNFAFCSVANFSLACYQFRQIAFKRCFARLDLSVFGSEGTGVCSWMNRAPAPPLVLASIRTLLCSSIIFTRTSFWSSLQNLHELEIDFYGNNFKTLTPRLDAIFGNTDNNDDKISDQFSSLRVLKFTRLPRIDEKLLTLIASGCPGLKVLELSCVKGLYGDKCCWRCWQCSISLVAHSPIPDKYQSVDDLANAFAAALRPLIQLEYVYLGIFLSDEKLIWDHTFHESRIHVEPLVGIENCSLCDSDEARTQTMEREKSANEVLTRSLPGLKTIRWSSVFSSA